ncbi:nuclear transport factor 2 family protein [Congregibacter variabilis]|uniref:Nuclear transport factor 2 family protein n=1 Tax=Congregibacter variabilis TaxID=3081200 RepID=A0ABZ0I5L5_9GAMM|nr:nuclear transport factor 2 family protein [Congregibacter sp. IMCC43200]
MKKIVTGFAIALMSLSVLADHHGAKDADLHAAIKAFDHAYAVNDIESYFGFYADDATVYVGDGRVNLAEYRQMWTELMASGGGVELNEMSDLQVQVMADGGAAVATSFIDNRTRWPDGSVTTSRAFETDVWQRIAGEWKVVSLHYSEISPE